MTQPKATDFLDKLTPEEFEKLRKSIQDAMDDPRPARPLDFDKLLIKARRLYAIRKARKS